MEPTILIASTNPVKLAAVRLGFQQMFPTESFQFEAASVSSGVPLQPRSDQETWQGALQRAGAARRQFSHASYWVGIEGGVDDRDGELCAFAWVCILSTERMGKSRTGTFFLPSVVADLVHAGKELGEADDLVFGRSNSKQEGGAIGLLTGDVVDRTALYTQAVILALVPFKNPSLYR